MNRKITVLVFLVLFTHFPFAQVHSAEVFKWVDDKGTVHFAEDEEAIPEKYREGAEKRSARDERGEPLEKPGKEKSKRAEPAARSRETAEKKQFDTRKFESEVSDSFQNILSLWNDKKFDALYECGDRKSRMDLSKEDFTKRMRAKSWELASSWERVRDIEVEVKNATRAYVTARIGYRPKLGGDTRTRTRTYEMVLENGAWRISLSKILSAPGK